MESQKLENCKIVGIKTWPKTKTQTGKQTIDTEISTKEGMMLTIRSEVDSKQFEYYSGLWYNNTPFTVEISIKS